MALPMTGQGAAAETGRVSGPARPSGPSGQNLRPRGRAHKLPVAEPQCGSDVLRLGAVQDQALHGTVERRPGNVGLVLGMDQLLLSLPGLGQPLLIHLAQGSEMLTYHPRDSGPSGLIVALASPKGALPTCPRARRHKGLLSSQQPLQVTLVGNQAPAGQRRIASWHGRAETPSSPTGPPTTHRSPRRSASRWRTAGGRCAPGQAAAGTWGSRAVDSPPRGPVRVRRTTVMATTTTTATSTTTARMADARGSLVGAPGRLRLLPQIKRACQPGIRPTFPTFIKLVRTRPTRRFHNHEKSGLTSPDRRATGHGRGNRI